MSSAQRKMNATIWWAQRSNLVIITLAETFNKNTSDIRFMLCDPEFRNKVFWKDPDYLTLYNEIIRLKEGPKRARQLNKIDNLSQ